jgi:hypothetical protein
MSLSSSTKPLSSPHNDIKSSPQNRDQEILASTGEYEGGEVVYAGTEAEKDVEMERKLVRKIDLRLCTIAGILCSLNLLDSGIISSASVTSIFGDLGLGVGNRYVSSLVSY